MQGYGSYRGRSGGRTFLKVLILLLVILLILAVAAFYFLEPYIVYTSNGIRLDLPLHGEEGPAAAATPPVEPVVTLPVVVTPEPEPEQEDFKAVLLPRSALTDGTAAAQLEAAGANAAIFDMKADDGSLGYISGLELARKAKASAAEPGLNEAIQALNAGEIYTVARVSCFRDNKLPYNVNATALRTNAGNWRDGENTRWLSPALPDARQYVVDVCVELAGLGFDEILLDHAVFPTGEDGKLKSLIVGERYPAGALDQPIEAFYREVSAALAAYPDVTLAIVSSEPVLDGDAGELSGQTVGQLAAYAGRVWAPAPTRSISNYAQSLEQAGMEEAAARVVILTDSLPAGEETGLWAVLEG